MLQSFTTPNERKQFSKLLIITLSIVIVVLFVGGVVIYQATKNIILKDTKLDNATALELGSVDSGETIMENLRSIPQLSMLTQAIDSAELSGILTGQSPVTLYAPTNNAFNALPDGTFDRLLLPENRDQLEKLLKNHILNGDTKFASYQNNTRFSSLAGEDLVVYKSDKDATINGSKILNSDVKVQNGYINIIDAVLLPPAQVVTVGGEALVRTESLAIGIDKPDNLKRFSSLIKTTDLSQLLMGPGEYTVFAPTDAAFESFATNNPDIFESLQKPDNIDQLRGILAYHIVKGNYSTDQLYDGQQLMSINGAAMRVKKQGDLVTLQGDTTVNPATIGMPNIYQNNGVLHTIDGIVIPPSPAQQ